MPLLNFAANIVDASYNGTLVSAPGQLVVNGPQVARGYFKAPTQTRKVFARPRMCTDTGSTIFAQSRSYQTGDLSRYLPDGTIAFMGRIDCQVKLRGFRVELGEIENVLLSLNSSVVSAACTLVNNEYLAAYVVVVVGVDDQKNVGSLTRHCSQHLPHYMVPSVFVFLDTMPLNRSGKVDRRALPVPTNRRRPVGDGHHQANKTPPTTRVEQAVARAFIRVLGLQGGDSGGNDVDVDTSFFELGGNSLSAVRLVHELKAASSGLCSKVATTATDERPASSFSLATVFAHPSIAAIAKHFQQVTEEELTVDDACAVVPSTMMVADDVRWDDSLDSSSRD